MTLQDHTGKTLQ